MLDIFEFARPYQLTEYQVLGVEVIEEMLKDLDKTAISTPLSSSQLYVKVPRNAADKAKTQRDFPAMICMRVGWNPLIAKRVSWTFCPDRANQHGNPQTKKAGSFRGLHQEYN